MWVGYYVRQILPAFRWGPTFDFVLLCILLSNSMPFLHLPLRSWNVFVGWICWWRQVTLGDSLKAHMETCDRSHVSRERDSRGTAKESWVWDGGLLTLLVREDASNLAWQRCNRCATKSRCLEGFGSPFWTEKISKLGFPGDRFSEKEVRQSVVGFSSTVRCNLRIPTLPIFAFRLSWWAVLTVWAVSWRFFVKTFQERLGIKLQHRSRRCCSVSYCLPSYLILGFGCVGLSFGLGPQQSTSTSNAWLVPFFNRFLQCLIDTFTAWLPILPHLRLIHSGKYRQDHGFSFCGYFPVLPCGRVFAGSLSIHSLLLAKGAWFLFKARLTHAHTHAQHNSEWPFQKGLGGLTAFLRSPCLVCCRLPQMPLAVRRRSLCQRCKLWVKSYGLSQKQSAGFLIPICQLGNSSTIRWDFLHRFLAGLQFTISLWCQPEVQGLKCEFRYCLQHFHAVRSVFVPLLDRARKGHDHDRLQAIFLCHFRCIWWTELLERCSIITFLFGW